MTETKQKNLEGKEIEAEGDVIVVTAPLEIDDGKHTGQITNVVRNLPDIESGRKFDYLDLEIKLTDMEKEPKLKCGFPTNISELSSLGRLLIKSGMEFIEGDNVTISSIKKQLVDRNITFLSKNEKTENGEFARIIRDTIEFA